jgi:hypothetical protein
MLSLPIIVIFSHQIWLGKQLFRFNKWTLIWFVFKKQNKQNKKFPKRESIALFSFHQHN